MCMHISSLTKLSSISQNYAADDDEEMADAEDEEEEEELDDAYVISCRNLCLCLCYSQIF